MRGRERVKPRRELRRRRGGDAPPGWTKVRSLFRARSWLWVPLTLALGATFVRAHPSDDWDAAVRLYETRCYSAAREAFGKIASARPDDPAVHFYLGRLALWFDDEPAARQHLERAVAAAPGEARLYNALGDAYALAARNAPLLSKFDWARRCKAAYDRAVAIEPGNVAYRWSLVAYYQLAPRLVGGGLARAHAEADTMARLEPMSGRIAQATLLLAEGRTGDAFALFDEVLRLQPDDFLALYHLGRCAALSGEQLDRGEAALRRCLELDPPVGDGQPTVASVHHRLGNILEKRGDHPGAEREYATARALQPDFRADKIALKN